MSLCRGATLCISQHTDKLIGEHLAKVVKNYQISHAILTPGVLGSVHNESDLKSIRVLTPAGEPLSASLAAYWGKGKKLLNGYDPTETTVITTIHRYHDVNDKMDPPIGRPILNTRVYVLDGPVPTGITSELYIGGSGVTRGYLNQPTLTPERFISDPFSTKSKARMYKTGDLVRWCTDGNLEYIGRNDFQIKLRGFRIEMGEIESKLIARSSEGIKTRSRHHGSTKRYGSNQYTRAKFNTRTLN